MDGEDGKQQAHLILANKLFLLTQPDVDDIEKVALREDVLNAVVLDSMLLSILSDSINTSSSDLFSLRFFVVVVDVVCVDMAPLYESLVSRSVLSLEQKVLDSMRIKNDDELKKLDEK